MQPQFTGNSILKDPQMIPTSMRTYDIVSKVAYMVGIKQEMFERDTLKSTWFMKLQEIPPVRVIRCLCKIRTSLMKNFNNIDYGIQYQLKNLDKQPNYFDNEDFDFLEQNGITVLKANYRTLAYLADVNKYIAENINTCREQFPLWLQWDYIKEMFIMPSGMKETAIKKELQKYLNDFLHYPFGAYINFNPGDNGNILLHDGKFVSILYASHGDKFIEFDKVTEAKSEIRHSLYEFIGSHESIAVMVDCENSDPYKLCAVLRNIVDNCEGAVDRINKIILYDDPHTASTWKILNKYIEIPVEHELIERVHDNKSLVDIRMTAGTCKEFYQNQITAFLIVSSDSDYWGLMSALPSASFLVMVEYEKFGVGMREALESAGILYCFIDDFCKGNINDIKTGALLSEINSYIESSISLNVNTMLDTIQARTRIDWSPLEKRHFYEKHIKLMKLAISEDGDVSIVLGK